MFGIFLATSVIGQDTLFQESFDYPALFPPMGWTNVKVAGTGAPGTWKRVTTGGSPIQEPHSDPAEAEFNSYFYPSGTASDLATPVIDFTVSGTNLVSFWMYRDAGVGTDKMEVYVNTTQASAGGTLIGTVNRNYLATPVEPAAGWYQYTFTVPSTYNTATNYVIFKGVSGYGYNIFIDDIAILRDPVVTIPGCATSIFPANGSIDICPNLTVYWDVVPYATGYKITMGNNPPNYNNVASNLDLGNALSFTAMLATGSNYKWKVKPYNVTGIAGGCINNSFTTATTPCYCEADFIEPSCSSLDFIDDVYTTGAVTNFSNMNTGCSPNPGNYTYYSGTTVSANQGSTFTMNLQSGPDYPEGFAVWIDWNRDGDFNDADEYALSSAPTTSLVSNVINVPATAPLGTTRMRIRAFYNLTPPANMYCDLWNEGETEDYNINVTTCTFVTYYQDADADGYGNAAVTTTSCTGAPAGYTADNTDCNDAAFSVHPGATELCNGIDENCNVTIDDNAAVAIITPSGPTTVCKGASLILNANTGVGYTYQWNRNGANLAGATGSSYSVTKSGNYKVTVTVPGGCTATSTVTTCTVNANPTSTISTPEGTNLCGLPDLDLVANAGAGFTYIWYKNGVIMPGINTQINTVNTIGDYRVKVANAAGCSKTSAIKTVFTSCKEGASIAQGELYPNPNNGQMTLSFFSPSILEGRLNVQILDLTGQVVFNEMKDLSNGSYAGTINASNLAAGLYLVKMSAGDTQIQQQVIIAK
ncbi:MAG TPA: GEVED domain-containing protein [Chitinophagales bacterium]|nr:GEVED domain-containing protein [Chitinophagales bacterium]HNA57046.1 GEVED domain-containing protein [Chitinophagales bacterium]HNI54632.1 GEVED domain-containing protein [Chitinophagales bacterium]HNJ89494.1 GEVED domain-containing protein [Chitinophagales bacterium]HNK98845.1 GEVED domain-containing protein [Chitinophagales bacterium]